MRPRMVGVGAYCHVCGNGFMTQYEANRCGVDGPHIEIDERTTQDEACMWAGMDSEEAYKAGWLAHHDEWCVQWDDVTGPVSSPHKATDTQFGGPR